MGYDFSGWATKNNLKCSDGRVIMKDAFKNNDGNTVPLVWNHKHDDPEKVLGHALLENRDEGVYAYCSLNDTPAGQNAKQLIQHGDITSLSIYANKLIQNGSNVIHGAIREVSLVLAGANQGAKITSVLRHGEISEDEFILSGVDELYLEHAEDVLEHKDPEESKEEPPKMDNKEKKEETKTVQDVIDTMNEEQQNVLYGLVAAAIKDEDSSENEEEKDMKHNVFENDDMENTLVHDGLETIIKDSKRLGSMKESYLQHAEDYGITNIDYLFPDDKMAEHTPAWIKRDTDWVSKVMNAVSHSPFSRIKSMFADITEDEARAKGYFKGNLKKEEVFSLLKRRTGPTTIYKKQKMDRDDIIDITDFDVVAWIKSEMRMMLDEEIARAILLGDQRLASSDDKIDENCVRPVYSDADLFTVKVTVKQDGATPEANAKLFIKSVIRNRKYYKGSGNPVLYTTEDMLTDMLLIEDKNERIIYDTIDKLKTALRVSDIVTVPVMEGMKGAHGGNLIGLIVNLADYKVGADKGGAINMFDDFDIDYNQQKYLIETRCSGALTKPFSAMAFEVGSSDGSSAFTKTVAADKTKYNDVDTARESSV